MEGCTSRPGKKLEDGDIAGGPTPCLIDGGVTSCPGIVQNCVNCDGGVLEIGNRKESIGEEMGKKQELFHLNDQLLH